MIQLIIGVTSYPLLWDERADSLFLFLLFQVNLAGTRIPLSDTPSTHKITVEPTGLRECLKNSETQLAFA
jgi:hypothetical protein